MATGDDMHARHARSIRILREWRTIWARRPADWRADSATWVMREIGRLEREADEALADEPKRD